MDHVPEPKFEDRRARSDRRHKVPDPDYSGEERRKGGRRTDHG